MVRPRFHALLMISITVKCCLGALSLPSAKVIVWEKFIFFCEVR